MPASWSGSIVFGMVSVPVQLFKATETHAGPKFHQVHEPDGGRIRLKRFCEAENKEVPYSEIAKGYEVDEDEQLILTPDDLDSLPIPSKNTIEVQAFVDAADFDPIQFDQAYYVGLNKRSPGKPYALLREAMREEGKVAVAKVTLTTRESLAILRVVDDLLVLHTMLWPDEVRPVRGIEPPSETVHANELKMAHSLMDAMSQDFSLEEMHDQYREAVEELIEAKLDGREPTAERPVPASNVVDITDILARSLEAEHNRRGSAAASTKTGTAESKPAPKKTPAKKASESKTPAKKAAGAKKTASRSTAKKTAGTRTTRKAG